VFSSSDDAEVEIASFEGVENEKLTAGEREEEDEGDEGE
jgi:hypothetical protein